MSTGTKPNSGYTLLELIVVLSILAAMAAVSIGGLSGSRLSSGEFRKISSALYADLIASQSQARIQGKSIVFSVSSDQGSYSFGDKNTVPLDKGLTIAIRPFLKNAETESEEKIIEFYSWGGASGGDVVLKGLDRQVEFSVDWLTGGISRKGE